MCSSFIWHDDRPSLQCFPACKLAFQWWTRNHSICKQTTGRQCNVVKLFMDLVQTNSSIIGIGDNFLSDFWVVGAHISTSPYLNKLLVVPLLFHSVWKLRERGKCFLFPFTGRNCAALHLTLSLPKLHSSPNLWREMYIKQSTENW